MTLNLPGQQSSINHTHEGNINHTHEGNINHTHEAPAKINVEITQKVDWKTKVWDFLVKLVTFF
jgi:hypothetical protein